MQDLKKIKQNKIKNNISHALLSGTSAGGAPPK